MTDIRQGITLEQHVLLDTLDKLAQLGVPDASFRGLISLRYLQLAEYGHTPEQDDQQDPHRLARKARDYAADAFDLLYNGHPQPDDHLRARGKALRSAAMALALVDQLDRIATNAKELAA